MIKTDMFDTVLQYVGKVCRVRPSDIINYSRVQSVVDARTIFVYFLYRAGFSNDDIAMLFLCYGKSEDYFPTEEEIKTKAKGIDKMRYAFTDKIGQNYIFSEMAQTVLNFLIDTYGNMYRLGMKRLPDKPRI